MVPWAIPLIAALFFFDSFRTAVGFAPVWTVRSSVIISNMILDFGPFAAGLAAWVASREGRRNVGDLLATTVRPAWVRQAAALGGTLFWLLLTFLIGVAGLYIDTARQATWGGPPLWPVVVGVVEVVTFAVIGFAVGALFPGRFAAPLAAIGTFVLVFIGFHAALNVTPFSATYALLSPATAVPLGDDGVFYHVAPDVAIAQVMFMGGICVTLAGVLVLAPLVRVSYHDFFSVAGRASRWLWVAAAVFLAAGVAASTTAFALTGTAKLGVSGWNIPALHDAASDQPVPYTPDCAGTSFKVCAHPAFNIYLGAAGVQLLQRQQHRPALGQRVDHGHVAVARGLRASFLDCVRRGTEHPGRFVAGRHAVTTAEVRKRPAAPAPSGRWPRRGMSGVRLVWLHLRSRRVPSAVLAVAVCAALLRAALHCHWMFTSGRLAQQLPMIIEAGAAVAVVVTTHSPFGEAERATGRWLPYLRLGAALVLTGLAIGILQLGVTGASLDGGVLVLARNIIGITGIGLLCSPVTGGG